MQKQATAKMGKRRQVFGMATTTSQIASRSRKDLGNDAQNRVYKLKKVAGWLQTVQCFVIIPYNCLWYSTIYMVSQHL